MAAKLVSRLVPKSAHSPPPSIFRDVRIFRPHLHQQCPVFIFVSDPQRAPPVAMASRFVPKAVHSSPPCIFRDIRIFRPRLDKQFPANIAESYLKVEDPNREEAAKPSLADILRLQYSSDKSESSSKGEGIWKCAYAPLFGSIEKGAQYSPNSNSGREDAAVGKKEAELSRKDRLQQARYAAHRMEYKDSELASSDEGLWDLFTRWCICHNSDYFLDGNRNSPEFRKFKQTSRWIYEYNKKKGCRAVTFCSLSAYCTPPELNQILTERGRRLYLKNLPNYSRSFVFAACFSTAELSSAPGAIPPCALLLSSAFLFLLRISHKGFGGSNEKSSSACREPSNAFLFPRGVIFLGGIGVEACLATTLDNSFLCHIPSLNECLED
ncbi:hypothetical protein V2J09_012421 [Rumex salicifolius]